MPSSKLGDRNVKDRKLDFLKRSDKMLTKKFYDMILPTRWLPMRAVICVMMFTACWTSYVCRLQMPVLSVPMIAAKASEKSGERACAQLDEQAAGGGAGVKQLWQSPDELLYQITRDERPKRQADDKNAKLEPRHIFELFSNRPYDWSTKIRGQLQAAYSYGNVPGNLLGGMMAIKFGPRNTILWTSLVAVIISLISPLLANIHWVALLISRIVIGLTGGVTFPACHTMVAKWSPPDEKARFVWSLLGGTFGTIFAMPMITGIADYINWESAWYIPSVLMLFWVLLWSLLVYDSPAEHPGISEEEKNYIIASQGGTIRAEKGSLKETPYKAIFTSIPFISLVICHFGNLFLIFFFQNSMMIYLTKALGFKLTKGGFLAALPWCARILFGFFFSWAGDIIKKKELVSLTTFRKCATIFSHMVPGIFLILVGYVNCSFLLAIVFLTLALGFNGAASIANLSNNQDLSPNYAGFLYGIMNTIGSSTGMLLPPMVDVIADQHGNTIDRWQIVFWIGGGVCIFCMIVFIFGGSAKIQSWNEPNQNDNKA